jgi:hypothetical protein
MLLGTSVSQWKLQKLLLSIEKEETENEDPNCGWHLLVHKIEKSFACVEQNRHCEKIYSVKKSGVAPIGNSRCL